MNHDLDLLFSYLPKLALPHFDSIFFLYSLYLSSILYLLFYSILFSFHSITYSVTSSNKKCLVRFEPTNVDFLMS